VPGGAGHVGPGTGAPAPGQPPRSGEELGAIVLAGGRASRLGGTDKPALRVGERSLIESVLAEASAAGARRVVVVGPDRPRLTLSTGELRVVREDPPGGGPVPALHRGLAEITAAAGEQAMVAGGQTTVSGGQTTVSGGQTTVSGGRATASGGQATAWVLLLAADLPFLRAGHLRALLTAARGGGQGTGSVLADDTGRPQWLASCWQVATLRRAAADYRGNSLHGLLRPLRPVLLALPPDGPGPPPWLDCDTPHDVRLARAWSANVRAGGSREEEDG
jgi:molybdenum cofactor guanylyltransferase